MISKCIFHSHARKGNSPPGISRVREKLCYVPLLQASMPAGSKVNMGQKNNPEGHHEGQQELDKFRGEKELLEGTVDVAVRALL